MTEEQSFNLEENVNEALDMKESEFKNEETQQNILPNDLKFLKENKEEIINTKHERKLLKQGSRKKKLRQ